MRRFCIHRGSATIQKIKKINGNCRLVIPNGTGRAVPCGISLLGSHPSMERAIQEGLGGVQGTVVALGSHVQQDKGWLGSPQGPAGIPWNGPMDKAAPSQSFSRAFLPHEAPGTVLCLLRCPLLKWHCLHCVLEILTGNPDPKSPFLASRSFQPPPQGQHGTFGIMRHRRWHGTLSMDNGPGLGRSFPAWEHHYPGIRAERCDGILG